MSGEERHQYDSGVHHDTHPDDVWPCCDRPRGDPIHLPPSPPPRLCTCDYAPFRHYWDPRTCKDAP